MGVAARSSKGGPGGSGRGVQQDKTPPVQEDGGELSSLGRSRTCVSPRLGVRSAIELQGNLFSCRSSGWWRPDDEAGTGASFVV